MSSRHKNLSDFSTENIKPSAKGSVGIVVSEWNTEITQALLDGALNTLISKGIKKKNIYVEWVPGSFELPLGARWIYRKHHPDAVICLGCVIQGETRHFDFICSSVAQGIMNLNLEFEVPFIFGVLTPSNQQQALDRSGGKYGNKGDEAAGTALKMMSLKSKLT